MNHKQLRLNVIIIALLLTASLVAAGNTAPEKTTWLVIADLAEPLLKTGTVVNAPFPAVNAADRNKYVIVADQEWQNFLKRQPVLLENEVRKGEERSAKAIGLIPAPATAIVAVLEDFAAYTTIFKQDLREAHYLGKLPDGSDLVDFRIFDSWPKKKYYANRISREGTLIHWQLAQLADLDTFKDQPTYSDMTQRVQRSLDDFKLNSGSWQLIEGFNGGPDTLAVYTISLRLAGAVMGGGLATGILNSLTRDNMPRVVAALAEEVAKRAKAEKQ